MTINFSSIGALQAQRQLGSASSALARDFERLSSGMRINRASDDAAGLAISMGLDSKARIYGQSIRNINDGISALNIADGATQELSTLITRLRELSEQSASGTLNYKQRSALNNEAQQLYKEYNRIVETTKFNNIGVISSGTGRMRIQAGTTSTSEALFLDSANLGSGYTGNGTFSLASSFSMGSGNGNGSASGDFNGDGKMDIVAANTGSPGFITVRLGNGDGTFGASRSFSAGQGGIRIDTADFNLDGNVDIVTADATDQTISVFTGNGDGTFRTRVAYNPQTGAGITQPLATDLNGDGAPDLVIGAIAFGGKLSAMMNRGDGTFNTPITFSMGTSNYNIKAGDLNGDGKTDLVSADEFTGYVDIRFGAGDGTFGAMVSYYVGNFSISVALGDMDNDGDLDLVAADEVDTNVAVLLNNGNGSFKLPSYFESGTTFYDMQMYDFNGDGYLDIAGADLNNPATIMLGNGNGTFKAAQIITGTPASAIMTLADFNGDGVKDIYSSSSTGENGIVLTGTNSASTLSPIDLSTRADALQSMLYLEGAASRLSLGISRIGSEQSRLQAALGAIQGVRSGYQEASARIVDVDVATEAAKLARDQILQQTASSMLSQVNLQSRLVLDLLR